ncbi:MAG: hypothetical protein HC857_08820 [Synechococcales cyanobacterium RU_4_20]|nr:hypothetical protein [Synechococcales cyanobacterium RU_4_20]
MPAPTPVPAPVPTPAPVPALAQGSVDYAITQTWGTGFTGYLTFQNGSDRPLNGWTFEFKTPFKLRQVWNAAIVSQAPLADGQGYRYVVRDVSWTRTVAAGGSAKLGFNVDVPPSQAGKPFDFVLDGRPIGAPAPPPAPIPTPTPPAGTLAQSGP